ncbi:hypothetical protein BCR35DRAFT_298850 [Leucosporidium creatinivorum]|uniref:Uncharacterized protein n=1 Tax=Leucosporidium creatinivorum TaxID=106004 RepID=A0A1Y2G3S5_9BASI|nr:hypothetical protein BCR35DRAFT_298850 [Leucosporidium creatinivorum]
MSTEDIVDGVPSSSDPPPYAASIAAPLLPRSSSTRSLDSHPAFSHPQASATGLPSGYFLLRSRTEGQRTFDLLGHRQNDGAEIGLHPVKEPVLRAGASYQNTLQIPQNNQVLYLDYDGHLNSACASRPIDASLEDGLSLAVTHPIMPIPSRNSHPLPVFKLDPTTSTLHVLFAADPTYPGPDSISTAWRDDYDYIVEAVASKRSQDEASVWTAASDGLASASKEILGGLSTLGDGALATLGGFGDKLGGLGLFTKSTPASPSLEDGPPPPPTPPKAPWDSSRYRGIRGAVASPAPLASSSFPPRSPNPDAPLPSLPPGDPYDSDESDSDPSPYRPLRIVRLPRSTWKEKIPSEVLSRGFGSPQLGLAPASSKEVRKWRRRQWEVVPIVIKARPVDSSPSLGSLFTSRAPSSRPLPPTSSLVDEHNPASTPPSRWSSSLASSAGGLVSTISGTLRTPILTATGRRVPRQDEEDDVRTLFEQSTPAVGDEDAMAIALGDIERFGRTSGERERAARARSAPETSLEEELGSDAHSDSTPSLVAIPLTPAPGPSAFDEPTAPTISSETRDDARVIEEETESADSPKLDGAEPALEEQEQELEGKGKAKEVVAE